MRLVWAQYALDDRETIFSYIESADPRAAVHVDEEIVGAARRLLDVPESGRSGRIVGTRELVVPRTPYIAAYVVTADRIRMLRVLHGAQMWPVEFHDE
jgi:toxin ParE1/3/4